MQSIRNGVRLTIHCRDYYTETEQFASQKGLWDDFQANIDCLINLAKNFNAELHIYKDFDPHSFTFALFRDGDLKYNGGIIYHPIDAPDNSHSVEVCPSNKNHWSIHT